MSGFCTECGARIDSFEGVNSCPACGTTTVPCRDDDQTSVSINWNELRILVIWAENWQRLHGLGRVVYAIAKRIEAQRPAWAAELPLTFAGELGQIAANYEMSVTDPDLRRDIAEQTGQETGLISLDDCR